MSGNKIKEYLDTNHIQYCDKEVKSMSDELCIFVLSILPELNSPTFHLGTRDPILSCNLPYILFMMCIFERAPTTLVDEFISNPYITLDTSDTNKRNVLSMLFMILQNGSRLTPACIRMLDYFSFTNNDYLLLISCFPHHSNLVHFMLHTKSHKEICDFTSFEEFAFVKHAHEMDFFKDLFGSLFQRHLQKMYTRQMLKKTVLDQNSINHIISYI